MRNCKICGKTLKGRQKATCSKVCSGKMGRDLRPKKLHRLTNGYKEVYSTEHNRKNKYIREHLLVMGKHLGRDIKYPENVHHIDGDKLNNDLDNLFLCLDVREHTKIHKSMERLVFKLLKEGLVKFNRETKEYEAVAKLWLSLNKK